MDFGIFILAGGQSVRMGSDKGLIKLKGKAMIEYVIEIAKYFSPSISIVTNKQEYEMFNVPLIPDEVNNEGPAMGIYSALHTSHFQRNLILSCDMPLISNQVIELLLAEQKDDLVVFGQDKIYPFPGLYKKSLLNNWKEQLNEGERKLQHLIRTFHPKILPIHNVDLFLNVNTPSDVALAEQKLKP